MEGSVAQSLWDSPDEVRGLGGEHEQACPSDHPHDPLAVQQRGPEGAGLGSLIGFDPEMDWLAVPRGGRGRPASGP